MSKVAIKVLPASVAGDADRLARFQREAEVLAALSHPNIAAIYGLEKSGDVTALVMELVEGRDLSEIIAAGISITDALPIAIPRTHNLEDLQAQCVASAPMAIQRASWSTDGKWLAYLEGVKGGTNEVYVQPYCAERLAAL